MQSPHEKKFPLIGVISSVIFFAATYLFYAEFDPNEMRVAGIFPWDSGEYRKVSEQIGNNGLSQLNGKYPFAPRLLFPTIYSVIEANSPLTHIESAQLVNIISSLLVVLFTFLFLQKNGVPQKTAFAITAAYMVFWLGPMRYSNYYPGGGFAFESLLICILFIVLERSSTKSVRSLIVGASTVFFLAIGREVVFYLLAISLASVLCNKLLVRYCLISWDKKFLKDLQFNSLVVLFLASLGGYLTARILVEDISSGQYSILKTIHKFGSFHLHIGEFLYPLFYALGPLFLCFLLALSLPRSRSKLIYLFSNQTKQQFFVLIFTGSAIIFAMTGGSDSDRFLLWFFPFLALIGAYAFTAVWSSINKYKTTFAILVIIVAACWTRFYVPAIPNVFFPGKLYNSAAGVRSDLSPQLFYGPKIMEKFRLPLQVVPSTDTHVYGVIDNPQALSNYQPNIPASIARQSNQSDSGSPYKGGYAYEINNIPFPLGFAHNQFELLVAHPYHGDKRVRTILLAQWLFLFSVFYVLCRKWQSHN